MPKRIYQQNPKRWANVSILESKKGSSVIWLTFVFFATPLQVVADASVDLLRVTILNQMNLVSIFKTLHFFSSSFLLFANLSLPLTCRLFTFFTENISSWLKFPKFLFGIFVPEQIFIYKNSDSRSLNPSPSTKAAKI